jgi:hypothetical protein
MMPQIQIRGLVSISLAELTEVNIKRDFDDTHKMECYVPNEASRRTMAAILSGLMPTSTKRVHLFTGTYGSGKSHFGLILAALLRKQPEADVVLDKVRGKDEKTAQFVQRHLDASKKYLVVVPDTYLYSTGFNRALLVALHQALKREGMDFRPRSYYEAAINVIERWQQEGSKKPQDNPFEKLRKALITHKMTPEILKDNLSECSDEAYDVFQKVYGTVTYGADFQPDASTDPTSLYAQTVEYLRSTGEWEGVWVICDEFGPFLTKLAQDPKSFESLGIQEFAEYCKRSDENQCNFVIIAHQTLAEYASGFRSQEEWEKISGRFIGNEHSLENIAARHEDVEMISTIIVRRADTDRQKNAWQEMIKHPDLSLSIDNLRNAGLYDDQEENWLQNTLMIGCFPLHPFATYCLPWLAQKVGQRERTLFTFFNDPSESGLRHFVDNESLLDQDKRLRLFSVDRLIFYFGPAAESKPQYKQVMRARQETLPQVEGSPLAQRLINALAVFEIVGLENLQPIEENLLAALHLSASDEAEAKRLLVELSEEKIIRKRVSGFFELRQRRGEFDLQEAIQEAKEELRPTFSALDALRDQDIVKTKMPSIQAGGYEKEHFVTRAAARELAVSRSLSNPKDFLDRIEGWYQPNRKKYEGDALVLCIVAEDSGEIEQAKRYAMMEMCRHPQLVLAVPKEPAPLTEILLDIAAAEQVKEKVFTDPNREEADVEELEQIIEDERAIVDKRLDSFLQADRLVWYCNGDSTASMEKGGEEEYISNLLENCFSKTPAVRDATIANIAGINKEKKHRYEAMARLLEHRGDITIKKTRGSAVERILRTCLVDTEVLEKREDKGAYADFEVRASLPEGSVLEELWQLLRNSLMQRQRRVELGNVVRELLGPPYGLSHQLTEILLTAFFRNRLDEFVIWGNYQQTKQKKDLNMLKRISLEALTIVSIVSNPDDYVLAYYEVRPAEREYVNRIIELVVEGEEEVGEMGIWERGRDALLGWFTDLPPISTSAKVYQVENTSELVGLLEDSVLMQDAKELFRSRLPAALDLTLTSAVPTEDEVEELVSRFEKCYVELVNYAGTQARILISELVTSFEAEGSTREDLALAIRNWYNSRLSESQRLHTFGGDAGHLKRVVEAEGTIDKRMLKDLPEAMGLGTYTSWTETTISDLFLTKVKLAKNKIESWQPQVSHEGREGYSGSIAPDPVEMAKVHVRDLLTRLGLSDDLQRQVLMELLGELE